MSEEHKRINDLWSALNTLHKRVKRLEREHGIEIKPEDKEYPDTIWNLQNQPKD